MKCPNCNNEFARCPECGHQAIMGTIAHCENCNCPVMDCSHCSFTVEANLKGVLRLANDNT